MQSPPFPRYLVPPRSKYSPQHLDNIKTTQGKHTRFRIYSRQRHADVGGIRSNEIKLQFWHTTESEPKRYFTNTPRRLRRRLEANRRKLLASGRPERRIQAVRSQNKSNLVKMRSRTGNLVSYANAFHFLRGGQSPDHSQIRKELGEG